MNEASSALIQQLQDPDRNVRARAAMSLGEARDLSSVDALLQALSTEPHFFTREYMTWSLLRLGDSAIPPLIRMLSHESPVARRSAAHTLSKFGDARARDALVDALSDSDAGVLSKAALALGKIGDPKAIPELISLLSHQDKELRATLALVLEEFGSAAVQPLLHALAHEDGQVREQAADILRLIGSQDAVPALVGLLNDGQWQVRFAAVHALGRLGGPAAREAIERLREDSHHLVRALVPKMIARMDMLSAG